MSNLGKFFSISAWGIFTGINAYSALDNILEAANTKAVVLQTQLSNTPELTEQLYHSARETAEKVTSGDYSSGLIYAVASGMSLGMCLYYACRKDED